MNSIHQHSATVTEGSFPRPGSQGYLGPREITPSSATEAKAIEPDCQADFNAALCTAVAQDDLQIAHRLKEFRCPGEEQLQLVARLVRSIETQTKRDAGYVPAFDMLSALAEFAYIPSLLPEGVAVQNSVREFLSAILPELSSRLKAAIYEPLLWAIGHELRQPEGTTPHALVHEAVELAMQDRSTEGCMLLVDLIRIEFGNPNYYRVLSAALDSRLNAAQSQAGEAHPNPMRTLFREPDLAALRQELLDAKCALALQPYPVFANVHQSPSSSTLKDQLLGALVGSAVAALRHTMPETCKWLLQIAPEDVSQAPQPHAAQTELIERLLARIPRAPN